MENWELQMMRKINSFLVENRSICASCIMQGNSFKFHLNSASKIDLMRGWKISHVQYAAFEVQMSENVPDHYT